MIYDIVISDQAEIDLRGILEYIAFELQAPENASGQLDRLEACIMDLDHMPKRYRQYELEPWKSRGLRVAPVDNYLVLYIPAAMSLLSGIRKPRKVCDWINTSLSVSTQL